MPKRPGPAPTPTKLKIARGNPGRRPLNKKEPQPRPELLRPPRGIDKVARKQWEYLAAELHRCGLLTRIDRPSFELYCSYYGMYADAQEKLRNQPLVIAVPDSTGGTRPRPNPYFDISLRAGRMMMSIAVEFGMTPASRSRIRVELEEKEESPFASFEPDTAQFDQFRKRSKKGEDA